MLFRGSAVDLTIKVEKGTLIDILTTNLNRHKEGHKKAVEGYKTKLIEHAQENLARAEEGKHPQSFSYHGKPKNYASQYERALGMLKLADEGPIKLSAPDYARFVEDDWDWKKEWAKASAFFSPELADDFVDEDEDDDE